MKSRLKVKDIATAVDLYYTYPELGTAEVCLLFGCSKSSAARLKTKARDIQSKKEIITFSSANVNTKCAYEAWGIDIADLEKRLIRYQKIQKGMKT